MNRTEEKSVFRCHKNPPFACRIEVTHFAYRGLDGLTPTVRSLPMPTFSRPRSGTRAHRSALPAPIVFLQTILLLTGWIWLSNLPLSAAADNEPKRTYDLPSADAASALKEFSAQSGRGVIAPTPAVRGVRTNSVRGELTASEALEQMLAGTGLVGSLDAKSGTFAVRKKTETEAKNRGKAEQREKPAGKGSRDATPGSSNLGDAPPPATAPGSASESQAIILNPFQVNSDRDKGYRKLSTVTSSRIGVPIMREPLAIEVISSELLKDFSVTEALHVFRYTSSVTVGEGEIGQPGILTMRGFQMPRFFNGVQISSAASIEPFLDMDNIDRVEIAKGSIGLFFANTTPNGVANYVTKKPQFTEANSLRLSYGSFNYNKVSLDIQNVFKDRDVAWRLIAARYSRDGRVNRQHRESILLAPSVVYRPNNLIEVSAELNYTLQKNPYGTLQSRALAINPQTYKDLTNPSQEILNFMKSKYGLTTDAQARAKVEERYGRGVLTGLEGVQGWNTNWQNDTFERTGVVPFILTGDKIEWWRFSPEGDKFNLITGNLDGDTLLSDISVVLTPRRDLSVQYHWLRMHSKMNLVSQSRLPNGGLRPDGRIWNSTMEFLGITDERARASYNDAQMLDVVYDKEFAGIKNKFVFGAEMRRRMQQNGARPIDYSKALPTVAQDGSTLTAVNAYRYWDPFGTQPEPDPYTIVSGSLRITSRTITENRDLYFSYRGQALNDKLNVLAGMRNVRSVASGINDNTWTVGAVYEVLPGFRLFASAGKNVILTSARTISGAGVVAADNARLLDSERGSDLEIGVKTDWMDNTLSGSISYYDVSRNGIIRSSFNKNSVEPRNYDADPNNNVTHSENAGKVRAEGIDGDIAWTPNRKFQAILNFSYEFDVRVVTDPTLDPSKRWLLTYIKAKYYRPMKSPLWRTNLITKYNFIDGRLKNLSVGSAIRSSAKYNMTDGPNYDLVVPSETIIDLFATYTTKLGNLPTSYTVNVVNATNTINDLTRSNGLEARLTVGLTF